MRSLAKSGKSIIFITHKLREVLEVADRITVIRRGQVIGTTMPRDADQNKLAAMMVGREVVLEIEKAKARPAEVTLRVKNLMVVRIGTQLAVDGVSFEVRAGKSWASPACRATGRRSWWRR